MSNNIANIFNAAVTFICLILVGVGCIIARRAETTLFKREAREVAVHKSARQKREKEDKLKKQLV